MTPQPRYQPQPLPDDPFPGLSIEAHHQYVVDQYRPPQRSVRPPGTPMAYKVVAVDEDQLGAMRGIVNALALSALFCLVLFITWRVWLILWAIQ